MDDIGPQTATMLLERRQNHTQVLSTQRPLIRLLASLVLYTFGPPLTNVDKYDPISAQESQYGLLACLMQRSLPSAL